MRERRDKEALRERNRLVHQASHKYGEHNDCTVIALANATAKSYDRCHAVMTEKGRKNRKGAYDWQYLAAAKDLGFDVFPRKLKAGAKLWRTVNRGYPEGTYLVRKTRHLAALVDGELLDGRPNRDFRVQNVWELRPRWNGAGSQRDLFTNRRESHETDY